MISTLRTLCALKGVALAARTSGKIKAVIQGISIFSIISFYVILASALYTLFSGAEYIYTNRLYIKQAWKKSH